MSNYVIVDPFVGAPTPTSKTDVHTTFVAGTKTLTSTPYPLGMVVRAVDANTTNTSQGGAHVGGGMFQYVVGAAASADRGYWVMIQGNTAVALDAASSGSRFPIGVAAGKLSATNVYGWVQVQGQADYVYITNTNQAAGAPLYICAGTTGLLVTNVVNGNYVSGVDAPVSCASATGTLGSATFDLMFPKVIGLTVGL